MADRVKRLKKFQLRLTEKDLNRIRILAREYAGGNVSAWLVHGGLNAPRQYLVKKEK
jgi:hypothetical protein